MSNSVATLAMSDPNYRRDLGDGLVLRWSRAGDVGPISDLYARVFRGSPDEPLNEGLPRWTEQMMSGRHPLIGPGDFAVVENTRSGAIVASTCLLSEVWEYTGIAIPLGRPEIVASDPAYRRRGLVRAVFDLIHARSATLGHLAQGITGIAYYYRVFGYEYALELEGGHRVSFDAIPALKDGSTEPYALREATPADGAMVAYYYDRQRATASISTRIDEPYWRWLLIGSRPDATERWRIYLITQGGADGPAIGYVALPRRRWQPTVGVFGLALDAGYSYAAVLPSLLRALRPVAEATETFGTVPPVTGLLFDVGQAHPAYEVMGPGLRAVPQRPYAWYVRVPDLPALLRHIAPALDARLAASAVAGYSGEVTLDFYRGGLRLVFEHGRFVAASDWQIPVWGKASAGFPPLVFLKMVFGYRGLDDLRLNYPDVATADDEIGALLTALFPTVPSWVLPLD